ncbi:AzlD domain-containing protein [Umboniibacter marinipuniceus]|uniref:Branched-subunit amino acid transport protein n=1 Tax=Umboniibacter marinipuniceus TaxID=569599 RepID=A0A3M0AAH7_9GAMM|nr:AzlD domain-containing protein [Umboniibacter marinipuniceus]RMA82153.1 branched-subunit amino acid transport protein [Umboniibacter marinipuniceus]
MIWLTIAAMFAIVFASRYIFLEPRLPIRLGTRTQRFLSFTAPAVMTAIWAPIVFIQQQQLVVSLFNPYLVGALVTAVVAFTTKRALLAAVLGIFAFAGLMLLG